MIKAQLERLIDAQRAAEPHTAVHGELTAPFEEQPDHLQKILVPAYGDSVLGNYPESGRHALVERLIEFIDFTDRAKGEALPVSIDARPAGFRRFDLKSVQGHNRMPVVHQMMRKGRAGRSQADHQHLVAAQWLGNGSPEIERIPPGQQTIDLETPGELE